MFLDYIKCSQIDVFELGHFGKCGALELCETRSGSQVRPGETNAVNDGTRDVAKHPGAKAATKAAIKDAAKRRQGCERKDCTQNMQQRCGKVGTQRCGKDAVQFQSAGGNVAKWVAISMASSAHERNLDTPKKMHHAPVKQQRGLLLGHHTTTELQQRQLPIHHKPIWILTHHHSN